MANTAGIGEDRIEMAGTEGTEAEPGETAGLCRHADVCGGCAFQGVPYHEQLEIKNTVVLERLAMHGIVPREYRKMRQTSGATGYRNKMEYSFGDETKGGPMTLGLHKKGSYMSVINTDGCLIVPESFNLVRTAVYEWALTSGHGFYHKRAHSGFLRSLVLRRGERTGELLVNLVTTSEETLDETGFCEVILSSLEASGIAGPKAQKGEAEAGQAAASRDATIVGILHTVNDRRSDAVVCDSVKTLYGRDHYFENLLGLSFRVGAFTFFQTNTTAVENMFREAFALIPGIHSKNLYDVYCGTGLISLALSRQAGYITGIELSEDSVFFARENAARNEVNNVSFICGDAFEELLRLPPPDLLILDPPRMGLHPKALKRIIDYNLPAIIYISCNPKTFALNTEALIGAGYGVSVLGAYDNFPYTKHIELVSLIEK